MGEICAALAAETLTTTVALVRSGRMQNNRHSVLLLQLIDWYALMSVSHVCIFASI
jgi:hypothetical protein